MPVEYQMAIKPAEEISRPHFFKSLIEKRIRKFCDHLSEEITRFEFPVEAGAAIGGEGTQGILGEVVLMAGARQNISRHFSREHAIEDAATRGGLDVAGSLADHEDPVGKAFSLGPLGDDLLGNLVLARMKV